jgi:chemosensory pili system protein ChpA (sensor histidine kinase/response regulator)
MADNRNFAALDWLIHEISETLKEARQALEAYVENPKDTVRIRFCLTHIHQVHGSLQMVEFFGAAMLAEEMERLTQAMIQGAVANASEAQEVLMRAILQFPAYLEQVKNTRKDNPLIVLPLLNDLRAVRGESLLTDTKLFVPNLAPAKKISGARSAAAQDNVQFQAMALKLRQMYQYAAAGFIRSVNGDENLAYLQKVFSRLQKLTQGTARFALWDICLALAEALETDALEISAAIKNILRQLDKEIKILAVHGTTALNSYTNDELIKNLLYYVARAGKHTTNFNSFSQLQRIYETYNLADALIEGKESSDDSNNMLSAPDPEALRSVVEALKTELGVIKQALNVCLSGENSTAALDEALPVVKRIADTMAVLGLGDLRKQVLEQGAALELMARSSSQLSNEQLISIAGKVIEIEDSLDKLAQAKTANNLISGNEGDITLTRAKESVLRESRNGLEHAKDAIIEYIASQWDRVHLQHVPETLREIRGGLEIMPLPRAARILGACARYIEEKLLAEEFTPQWSTLDTLADAITSVEYYLERLSSGATNVENDLLLSVAEESVAALGYAVAKANRSETIGVDSEDNLTEFKAVVTQKANDIQTTMEDDEASLAAAYESALHPEPIENQSSYSLGLIIDTPDIVRSDDLDSLELKIPAPEIVPEVTRSALPAKVEEKTVEVTKTESLPVSINPASPAVNNIINDDENDIDEEIIEIFVEEAGEVFEAIQTYFPQWAKDFDDHHALNEFRRAFHTLKGSGRMVGAHDIGELSWSIENMLNRIIDKTIEAGHSHIVIIEKVCEILPSMITAFSRQLPNPHPSLSVEYRGMAESLAKGIVPEGLTPDEPFTQKVAAKSNLSDSNFAPANSENLALDVDMDIDEEIEVEIASEEIIAEDLPRIAANHYAEIIRPSVHLNEDSVNELAEELAPDLEKTTASANKKISASQLLLDELSDDSDVQLRDIFAAEALTHLQVIEEYIAHMEMEAPCYEPPSDSIQRALHTLKGSAHMAEITPIAELVSPLEKFVKELRSYHLTINDDILQLLRDAVSYANTGLEQIANNEVVAIPKLQQFLARVSELREIHIAPLVQQQEMDAGGKRPVDPELLSIFMAEEMNLLLDADKIIAQWQANPSIVFILSPIVNELRNLTRGAYHAYLPPMAELGEKIEKVYERIIAQQLTCSDTLCHTLNRAHIALLDMVDAVAAGQNLVATPADIETALNELLLQNDDTHYDVEEEENISHLDAEEISFIALSGSTDLPFSTNLTAENDATHQTEPALAIENESYDIGSIVNDQSEEEDEEIVFDELPPLTEINYTKNIEYTAEDLEISFEELPAVQISKHEAVNDDVTDVIEGEIALNEEPSTAEINYTKNVEYTADDLEISFEELPTAKITHHHEVDEDLDAEELFAAEEINYPEAVDDEADLDVSIDNDLVVEENIIEPIQQPAKVNIQNISSVTPANTTKTTPNVKVDDDFDSEIVEIFIEEALELLEDMERALHEWQEDWSNTNCAEELKRCLHTFKGGARLAGLTNLGDLSHDYETVVIDLKDVSTVDQTFFKQINDFQDRLHAGVTIAQKQLAVGYQAADDAAQEQWDQTHLKDAMQATEEAMVADDESVAGSNNELTLYKSDAVNEEFIRPEFDFNSISQKPNVLTFAPKPKAAAAQLPKIPGSEYGGMRQGSANGPAQVQHLATRRAGPQEVVKVSAELLEELVNLAGETSISRGRMEQQVIDLGGAIGEMDSTIQRLQEQLRRLDIETEAQVVFRQEKMAQHEDFDPLEMDRYSQLQQLSRSLIESASDLMDLKFTLADKTRDTETLLLQQSRINTDLQEGLMRSRMVPFSRLVPRLRRIVRQAATELGKEVDFELDNVEGELDRTVLERMVAPLEHMLRNAVDHGIESLEGRAAAGKSPTGRIVLRLSREGGDVMLRLSDDGRGINLQRVREKAIERGLMSEDAYLSDQDLMQFILHAGFSTADKVTQISGRGVGMDVVHSEIKQLGGAMFIDSRWGEGTEFIIRLPFTVSVNRALMVQIGDDLYAIPLNTIEGIVRVSPFELEHYYLDLDSRFDYAGENYLVRYLGSMLDSDARPKLDGQSLPLPVVLVRSAENTVALQVDRLLGSREIVVKTLGVQFGSVCGVSGATVMGDGNVVVILDLHALIREQLALGLGHSTLLEPLRAKVETEEDLVEKIVMVVDDSVTVRKVTSRFLEREGYRVIAAKDGVEALQLLQDQIPDVMLLDIEMPRMDGFEVAKNMRTSSRLKDIPIIMITSRTGDKHRERAFDLGVNKYMGKPYQEDLLLANIQELTKSPVK